MAAILETCLNEGIAKKNYPVIRLLLPELRDRAEAIIAAGRRIARFDSRRVGRIPKWLEMTQEAQMLAGQIIDQIDLAGPEMDAGRWIVVGFLVRECARDCAEIRQQIKTVPDPVVEAHSVPPVFYEEDE